MYIWNKAPFIRLILPFLFGILIAIYFPFQIKFSLFIIIIMAFILAIVMLFPIFTSSYRKSWWFGLLVNGSLFLFSFQLTILKTEKFSDNHFSKYTNGTQLAYCRLTEQYLEKEKSLKVIVQVQAIKQGKNWKNTSGKAMLFFKKDSLSLKLKYGDQLFINANLNDIPPPQNPGEFNYKRFLQFHNVYNQAYIKNADWVYCGENKGNYLLKKSYKLRNNLLEILTENNLYGLEFAVGSALLLGYVDKLDADIISAYASTGALHILSVSGLHVAIIYIVFNWLLSFLLRFKYGNIIRAIILILLLWSYATLTGLSPSVLRAATMFSFIIIAKAYFRNTNIYNTLAASAFLLLLFNPYFIMDVGFQLSYIAVIGIIYIQPKIYDWFELDNWLLDQIWKITSVSIAAQIATFPLGFYYFNQFPNYFLFSNLIVIPISTAIIYLGIALFTFAKFSLITSYLAMGFGFGVWFLNQSVNAIEKWPYAVIQGISITAFETFLLYLFIAALLIYFSTRKFISLLMVFILFITILSSQLIEQFNQYQQKSFVIYNIPKTSAIDFISAKRNILLTDTAFAKNEKALLYRVKHNLWNLGINNTKIISENIKTNYLSINNNFIQFYDLRMTKINAINNFKIVAKDPIHLDYLIISENPKLQISEIFKQYNARIIVFDSSNSIYNIRKWKTECKLLNQAYYSVVDSGALIVSL